jgi:hypothetical protein
MTTARHRSTPTFRCGCPSLATGSVLEASRHARVRLLKRYEASPVPA